MTVPVDLRYFAGRIEKLSRRLDQVPRMSWATVVTTAPLTIHVDGDPAPILGEVKNAGPKILLPGTRVQVMRQDLRYTVISASVDGDLRGTSAQRVALGMSGAVSEGLTFYDTDENREYVWSGGQWRLVAYAAGVLPAVTVPPDGTVTTNVTFPTGRFTVPPVVIPGVVSGAATYISVAVSDVTTTGFTLRRGVEPTRGAFDVAASWYAIQTADM